MPTAVSLYKLAYDAHYKQNDVAAARANYERVIKEFPNNPEAGYARSQLTNLAKSEPEIERNRLAEEADRAANPRAESIVVTTAPSIEGRAMIRNIDIVGSEVVLGLDIFTDILAAVRDVFGGRSRATQDALRGARKEALRELRQQALDLGANAVVAISFAYTEFSGQGKSMVLFVVTGTAVELAPITQPANQGS